MMLPIKRIVCPTDFSEPSYEALKAAVELAFHFDSEICLVHVVAPVPRPYWSLQFDPAPEVYTVELAEYEEAMKKKSEQKLQQVATERIAKDGKWRTIVAQGDPATEIVQTADDEESGLIVIATHGLTGWRHLMHGSVAERVLRLANCPVLTIRAPQAKPAN